MLVQIACMVLANIYEITSSQFMLFLGLISSYTKKFYQSDTCTVTFSSLCYICRSYYKDISWWIPVCRHYYKSCPSVLYGLLTQKQRSRWTKINVNVSQNSSKKCQFSTQIKVTRRQKFPENGAISYANFTCDYWKHLRRALPKRAPTNKMGSRLVLSNCKFII